MSLNRRGFLATAAVVGVAGCLGGTGGDVSEIAGEDSGESGLSVPVLGDPDASVVVTVFEDFACPSCATFKADIFPQIERDYIEPEQIRYEHRDYPIPVDDQWSWEIPSAARAAQDEDGDTAFWAFADAIYQYSEDYSYEAIESVASDIDGIDAATVRAAAEDDTYRSDLQTERESAANVGVGGTPTVAVDGDIIEFDTLNELGEETLAAIDAALE